MIVRGVSPDLEELKIPPEERIVVVGDSFRDLTVARDLHHVSGSIYGGEDVPYQNYKSFEDMLFQDPLVFTRGRKGGPYREEREAFVNRVFREFFDENARYPSNLLQFLRDDLFELAGQYASLFSVQPDLFSILATCASKDGDHGPMTHMDALEYSLSRTVLGGEGTTIVHRLQNLSINSRASHYTIRLDPINSDVCTDSFLLREGDIGLWKGVPFLIAQREVLRRRIIDENYPRALPHFSTVPKIDRKSSRLHSPKVRLFIGVGGNPSTF